MKSFAVWYKRKASANTNVDVDVCADVHVNLFENSKDEWFIDFGLKISNIDFVDKVYLYVPFFISDKGDIADLVHLMDTKLLKALFNDNFHVVEGPPKRRKINLRDEDLIIYQLTVEQEIELCAINDAVESGTILAINTGDITEPVNDSAGFNNIKLYYFRFRIAVRGSSSKVINLEVDDISFTDCSLRKTEIIDFRLNNIRSLTDVVQNEINKGMLFSLKAVHFLILKNAKDLLLYPAGNVSTRMLEDYLWRDYFSDVDSNDIGDLIAYHFKEKYPDNKSEGKTAKGISEFNVLVRFSVSGFPKEAVACVVFFAIIVNMLSSYFYDILSNNFGNMLDIFLGR